VLETLSISKNPRRCIRPLTAVALAAVVSLAQASSHREAPFITTAPKVDATDFYMFMSYEPGRSGYVTLIANYQPLQDAYGGPNYFSMDPAALYEIHLDNNGDAKEDLTFQFRFTNTLKDITLPIGPSGANISIPLKQAGAVANVRDANLNVQETFTLDVVRGDRRKGSSASATNSVGGSATFDKPVDNIGIKTIANYPAYAAKHVHSVMLPGCAMPAKVFVGQRQDPFAVNLGTIFDLVNAPVSLITDPTKIGAAPNTLGDKNVTTLALEVHKSCLTAGTEGVIGGWTTASLRQARLLSANPKSGHEANAVNGGAWVQVSRLGMPLVNEVVIGLKDKDKFNASSPINDGRFLNYVKHPTLPPLINAVLNGDGSVSSSSIAPSFARTDLVATFLTGISGVNQPAGVVGSEMLRLNTKIVPKAEGSQARLGVIGGDNAGFPNGRRPKDDVVDVALVAVMGGLCMVNGDGNALSLGTECKPANVPLGNTALKLHDAVDQAVVPLLPAFPYLNTPIGGTK
jgi:hypothetical protein